VNVLCGLLAAGLQNMLVGGRSVILLAFFFHDFQGVGRTDIKTCPQTVTIDFFGQDGLVLVVKHESPLCAGRGAKAAAVAEIPINLDDFSFHHEILSFRKSDRI
jgi:hypothetical protein